MLCSAQRGRYRLARGCSAFVIRVLFCLLALDRSGERRWIVVVAATQLRSTFSASRVLGSDQPGHRCSPNGQHTN